ncbi:MAG TPA: 50S ribosomal protein L11 methyltransferase [Anaerolineales bacterium]|nr:50S ribosomal protein L11 methyltransferase [Anaerolineales bacterium]HRQ92079.1 50S ribosomal protein L11 methyltransferase [Anaerolineales bacterium]
MTASWLRIALEVDPEQAEAVSEALARYIPGGIVIESTAIQANDEDEGRVVGDLRVLGYIPNDEQLEERRAQIEQALRYLALIQPLPEPHYEPVQEQNWMEAWKQHYKPFTIGERLRIMPAWLVDDAAADGRAMVRIEPGMAFGTGVHPTTQLCLLLVEQYVQPGNTVMDIGCGSAILAIAAKKLGAGQAVGVDIDPQSMDNARQNAALNNVDIEIGLGSVDELLAGQYSLQQADVVLANILAPVLVRLLAAGMGRLVAPGGTLILSGILNDQEPQLRAALQAAGFAIVAEQRSGDWLALAAQALTR